MASLASRISLIVRSKANALIDSLEDPAEVIDQTIVDAKKEYADLLKQSTDVFVNEKKCLKDKEDVQKEIDQFNSIAEKAVRAGNDDDATQALQHVTELEEKLDRANQRYEKAAASAKALRDKLTEMSDNIKTMEERAAGIRADMATAKVTEKVSKVKVNDSAFKTFDRLAEKAEKERMAAETLEEFEDKKHEDKNEDLAKKYSTAKGPDVSDRLAALKAKVGQQ